MKKQETKAAKTITNAQVALLLNLVGKLKTKSLGLDDFEKFVDAKRGLKDSLARLSEIEKELVEKHNIKFTDESQRFFDITTTTKEERDAFNGEMIALQDKPVSTIKFITKKNLLALKNENDLSVDEYELLAEAFLKNVEVEVKPVQE